MRNVRNLALASGAVIALAQETKQPQQKHEHGDAEHAKNHAEHMQRMHKKHERMHEKHEKEHGEQAQPEKQPG